VTGQRKTFTTQQQIQLTTWYQHLNTLCANLLYLYKTRDDND
jgi:hypothetical protein